ncbi:uncharacterized protein LOC101450699 [Ceratitis capitata]|uniref:uncharacterized protein LOC101450699 n=1 Tax=Ceratitis capitata TaxID=7213 RepID=UPI000618944A|nr:uncharacterized protein LOC101450699 [Ceratitis capitata]
MSSITASGEYDKDELVPPHWLNNTFFEQVLKPPKSCAKIQIANITIQPATKKGEHYASVMFRVNVAYTLANSDCDAAQSLHYKSLIVKALPVLEGEKQLLLQDSKLFETEIGMYTEVVPQLVEELRLAGEVIRFGASCLHHSLTPLKVLVFEDLTQVGYEIVRGRTLTLEEIKMGYRKLAKWHAASYKLAKKQPAIFDKFRHSFMTIPYIVNSSFIASGISNFITLLDSLPTLKAFKPYFELLQPDWASKCRATYTEYFTNRHSENYYGICHGDFLNNNLMFSRNDATGELSDVLLVDYQLSYMGPLVNDLIYAFYMIYTAEQRARHHQELLKYYFKQFSATLNKLNFRSDSITFERLQEQLKRQKILALFLLLSFMPIRYALRAGLLDRDYMTATDEERKALYCDKNYIAELHNILPMYLNLGYLQ